MKAIFGLLLCAAGVALGLYVGVWWAFIGGIVDVIREIRATDLDALNVAIGVAKIVFAGLIGAFSGAVLFLPGMAMLTH